MKTKKLLLTVLFVFSPFALGKNLQPSVMLIEKTEDLYTNSAPKSLKLQRVYQSRSLHRGFLGYGWCLQFDKMLIKQSSGDIDYYSCESDTPVRFQLSASLEKGLLFKSLQYPGYQMIKINDHYILLDPGRHQWVFDTGGRLKRWTLRHRQKFFLSHNKDGTLEKLQTPEGIINIQQNSKTGLIEWMTHKQQTIHYIYENHLLTTVKSPTLLWNYEYDASRNLKTISKNQKVIKMISYDIGKDQVERLVSSSYVAQLNSAGQISSIEHPMKGRILIHYNSQGVIQYLELKNQKLALNDLKSVDVIHRQKWIEYLNVASGFMKNLKTL